MMIVKRIESMDDGISGSIITWQGENAVIWEVIVSADSLTEDLLHMQLP